MIVVENLYKTFGSNRVLRGVNLNVPKGETTVIIGGSGSGKSVLMKHIIGLLFPDQGRVLVDGEDLNTLSEADLVRVRRRFGMVFQGAALFDSMPVWQNVGFTLLQHTPMPHAEIMAIARERLEWVGLNADVLELMPAELSGGMRKRVGFARAIAMDPEILLYDEPTTGLDPVMSDVINRLIRSLQERLGVTAVMITHDIKSAYFVADHIGMLYQGEIVQTGTPDEISRSTEPLVQQFVTGDSTGGVYQVR